MVSCFVKSLSFSILLPLFITLYTPKENYENLSKSIVFVNYIKHNGVIR